MVAVKVERNFPKLLEAHFDASESIRVGDLTVK